MKNVKLETALIEVGKEVDKMKVTPFIYEVEEECDRLIKAMAKDDTIAIRKHGRQLSALVIKYMIEKL